MMEETPKPSECFLVREEPIGRLPKLVFAASEACRRGSNDPQKSKAALSKAMGAQCTLCGFVLSGAELLAMADIAGGNEKSAMLQRLRAGQCARENCSASHYRLKFFDTPEIGWAGLFAQVRPQEKPRTEPEQSEVEPVAKPAASQRSALHSLGRVCAVAAFCLFAWVWWRFRTGGTIPILREPEHFRVTPATVDPPHFHV